MSVANYCYTKYGLRPELEESEGFLAADRVMTAIGMNSVEMNPNTAADPETQFWTNVTAEFELSEGGMKSELALMVTDPNDRMKVEAIMEGRAGYLEQEKTKLLDGN